MPPQVEKNSWNLGPFPPGVLQFPLPARPPACRSVSLTSPHPIGRLGAASSSGHHRFGRFSLDYLHLDIHVFSVSKQKRCSWLRSRSNLSIPKGLRPPAQGFRTLGVDRTNVGQPQRGCVSSSLDDPVRVPNATGSWSSKDHQSQTNVSPRDRRAFQHEVRDSLDRARGSWLKRWCESGPSITIETGYRLCYETLSGFDTWHRHYPGFGNPGLEDVIPSGLVAALLLWILRPEV